MAESKQELSPESDAPNKTGTVSGPARGLATSIKKKSNTQKFPFSSCSLARGYSSKI